jgi:hypothetical protein
MDERIEIPLNAAGLRILAVMETIAIRIDKTAKSATEAYIRAEMPYAKMVAEWHDKDNCRYCVTVKVPRKRKQMLTYDYKTRTVSLAEGVAV